MNAAQWLGQRFYGIAGWFDDLAEGRLELPRGLVVLSHNRLSAREQNAFLIGREMAGMADPSGQIRAAAVRRLRSVSESAQGT